MLKGVNIITRRQNNDFIKFGGKIKNYRASLNLKNNSREFFISDRIETGILEEEDISIKTLSNIENGYTLPSIPTLLILSAALEVDIYDLINDLLENIRYNN